MDEKMNRKKELDIMLSYSTGMNVERIAEREQVSNTTIYNIVRKNNIPLKQDKSVQKEFRDAILHRLAKEGMTFEEVAKDMKLPKAFVNGYVNYQRAEVMRREEKKREEKKQLQKSGIVKKRKKKKKREDDEGLKIVETIEEKVIEDLGEEKVGEGLSKAFGGSSNSDDNLEEDEKLKLAMLRELLRYASTVTNIPDYSNDPLLVADYLLPVDILIMKDIAVRMSHGEDLEDIALIHRADLDIIEDMFEGGLERMEFQKRYISSLVKRGLVRF